MSTPTSEATYECLANARPGASVFLTVMGGRRSGEAAAKQQRDNHGKRMFHGSTLPSGT